MQTRSLRIALALVLAIVAAVLLIRASGKVSRELALDAPSAPKRSGAEELAAAVSLPATSSAGLSVRLETVASGFDRPLFVTHAGDGSGRLFVVEQGGKIRIVRDGKVLPAAVPRPRRASRHEHRRARSAGPRLRAGLRDLAAPLRRAHREDREGPGGAHRALSRCRPDRRPDRADPASESVVLEMADPAGNHNGGMIAFGPDGKLWAGTGDGGSGGDPWDNARNPASLLGKMLRLDVEPRALAPSPSRPRSGRSGCATPGASASTARPARSGSATSARTPGRRSTSPIRNGRRRSTSAGGRWRASTATTRARAAMPRVSSCRSTSMATTPAAR